MPTTLQPKNLLVTLKYDFKVMQRENSPNEVQKWYPRGTNCSNGVQLATLILKLLTPSLFMWHLLFLNIFENFHNDDNHDESDVSCINCWNSSTLCATNVYTCSKSFSF